MNTIFELPNPTSPIPQPPQDKTCRTCQYRVRGKTDEHATRYEQYCIKQRTKRNTVGYKKIKVTNAACIYYSEKHTDK